MEFKRAVALRDGVLLVMAIAVIAVVGRALPDEPLLRLAILAPVAYTIAILGNITTAVILFSNWRDDRVRSTLVLALSFAASAIGLFLASLMLPLLPEERPMFPGPTQSGIWLYIFWHFTAAIGALAYVVLRRDEQPAPASRRFTIAAVAATVMLVAGEAIAAFAFVRWLPVLAVGRDVSGLASSGIGPAAVVMLAVAAFVALRIRRPSEVDAALAFTLVALALEMTLLIAGAHRYTVSYFIGRILLTVGALFVLVAAVRALIDARVRLRSTEQALAKLSEEALMRTARIRALWAVASQPGQPIELIFDELLKTATSGIRPGKMMFGVLSHLEGESIVIDATAWSESESQGRHVEETIYPGARFDLSGSLAESLLAVTGTRAWNDLLSSENTGTVWEQLGWRSYIGKQLAAGRKTYFLGFASPQPMIDQPYVEDDCAYVDVVASFFETRFSEALHYERIQFQIEHDALTGLHNRAQFRNAIRSELTTGAEFAIAFVNLDEFRLINERQGHMLGDEVLVEVASTLGGVNPNNLVARMNGDEFGILLRVPTTPNSVERALDAYARQFLKPFQTGDRDGTRLLTLSASIGAARFPSDGETPEELMRRADLALSLAKNQGGATTVVFDPSMEALLEATHVRLAELAEAIAGDQLAVVYQPTFDLATRQIVGAEALVRWDHPERGWLLPAEFVPFAERNGLIAALTRWVCRRVISDISGVDFPTGFRVYFNVVAQTLDEFAFISELNDALRVAPNLAEHLGIELTETAAMQNIESAMHTINLLRKWSLSVAIDDFGTGYSSLSYLKKLSVDVIKIDRSFVTGLPDDERDGAITELLLQITGKFGVATLAEGIETESQARWLLEHGCRFGQGYLVARPDSIEALRARLDAQMIANVVPQ